MRITRRLLLTGAALALGTTVLGGAPEAAERIFALARMIGWTAHVMEEQTEPRLRFRLRGVYVGERNAAPD